MTTSILRRFYLRYFMAVGGGPRAGDGDSACIKRMVLLLQVTQWHLDTLSDEEYRHWT